MTISPLAPLDEALFLEDLEAIVSAESPSDDLEAVARSARVVRDVILKRLAREPETLVIDGVTHLRLRGTDPRVLLLTHHDTVWPVGTLRELPFSVQDGVIRGPGTFDMKVGLVQAIHALAGRPELLDHVSLLVTGDEEVGSMTSRALIEAEAEGCEAALVFEAAADGGALKTGRKGVSRYRIHVDGRAAHAGLEPERGVNAGLGLAQLVAKLPALADPELATTVTPTRLEAGTTGNTVPAAAYVDVDVRARSRIEQTRVDRGIRMLAPEVPGAVVRVEGGPNRPPMERAHSERLFARAQVLAARLGLPALGEAEVGGGSDGNLTAGIGVPTLDGLGAVGGGAHAHDEHALVRFVGQRTRLAADLIAEIVASPRQPA